MPQVKEIKLIKFQSINHSKCSNFMKNLLLLSALLAVSNMACLASTEQFLFPHDPDQMETEVLKYIPRGSSISKAEVIMKNNKFKCECIKNEPYGKQRDPVGNSTEVRTIMYGPSDFLSCDIVRSSTPLGYRRVYVAIAFKNNSVTNIVASSGFVGL